MNKLGGRKSPKAPRTLYNRLFIYQCILHNRERKYRQDTFGGTVWGRSAIQVWLKTKII